MLEKMALIQLLTGSHLCFNPRVIKEATALQEAGHQVQVLGGWIDAALKKADQTLLDSLKFQFQPLGDLTANRITRLWKRANSRLARQIHSLTGYESGIQLGYFIPRLRRAVRQSKAHLLIAHSEQALCALSKVSSMNPFLGVDMEDWFSEDLPAAGREHRPLNLLKRNERRILRQASHVTCTSRAMAESLGKEYQCPPPEVIYNAFLWADRAGINSQLKDRKNRSVPSIHWYSQTIGIDRGLGDLFAALPMLKSSCEIHLRGNLVAGFDKCLREQLAPEWRNRVFLHGLVSNAELLSRIAEHDIGFAGETRLCRSRDLTVTNKLLHYLLGGLAVVASDTAGQAEIAEIAKGAVHLYPSNNPQALAAILDRILGSPGHLAFAKESALKAAQHSLCWERQVPILLRSVHKALAG